jgi:aspartyl-tRNA(Asn)/glutamyl-tRNA(Gln) amidotransferase subunit A
MDTNSSYSKIREELINGHITVEELVKLQLTKAMEINKDINCFISFNSEQAVEQAKKLDNLTQDEKVSKPLLGLVVGTKDNILTKGVITTAASKMLESYNPQYSATVVVKLENAGALSIGKTNLDEFAMGSSNENSFFGSVKNPLNKELVPGGSSGGSAAAVASQSVPIALGTDTGGSVRQPAAFCGTVGLKPTYGRVSRYGVIAFASSLDQVGVLGRNAEETALMYSSLAGYDPQDATSADLPLNVNLTSLDRPCTKLGGKSSPLKGLRVGLPKEYFPKELERSVREGINKVASIFSALGAEIIDTSLPNSELGVATYYIIASAEAASNLARFDGIRFGHSKQNSKDLEELILESRSLGFGKETKRRIVMGTYVLSSGYYDAYYGQAQIAKKLIVSDFKRCFEDNCDLILTPTTPTKPFKLGSKNSDPLTMYMQDLFTIPVNLAGLPAINIPYKLEKEDLPIGFQLIGNYWQEELLLRATQHFENSI